MTKRIFAVIMSLALIMSITACGKKTEETEVSTTAMQTTGNDGNSMQSVAQNEEISANVSEKNKNDVGGGYIESKKYRQRYYTIPYDFALLVDQDELSEWEAEIYKTDPDETNKMTMVLFIQHFNISREDFDRTNLALAKSFAEWGDKPTMKPQDYENQQPFEIYNSDIIYTFDDEIINEYYLTPDYPFCSDDEYEYALKNGTYETRTTDWVDVEQMEAEINAKYGVQETTAVIETTAE
ncbi:MAG: hypothetical protein ACI4JG_08780 [Acutalibacteraceae bacterium]